MIQSLQPKGREFESTCVLNFLPLFDSFNFIYYRCTTTFEEYNFEEFLFLKIQRQSGKEFVCLKIHPQSGKETFLARILHK